MCAACGLVAIGRRQRAHTRCLLLRERESAESQIFLLAEGIYGNSREPASIGTMKSASAKTVNCSWTRTGLFKMRPDEEPDEQYPQSVLKSMTPHIIRR